MSNAKPILIVRIKDTDVLQNIAEVARKACPDYNVLVVSGNAQFEVLNGKYELTDHKVEIGGVLKSEDLLIALNRGGRDRRGA